MAQQALYRVLVKKNGTEAVVRPPFDVADGGNVNGFVIRNKTAADILVNLPDDVFDFNGDTLKDPGKVEKIAAGASKTFAIAGDARRGILSFQIFCEQTFTFAQGNSDPEFIIEN